MKDVTVRRNIENTGKLVCDKIDLNYRETQNVLKL